jgi:hypothetical protein
MILINWSGTTYNLAQTINVAKEYQVQDSASKDNIVKQVPALPLGRLTDIREHMSGLKPEDHYDNEQHVRGRDHTRDINPIALGTPSQVRGGCMPCPATSQRASTM